MFTEQRRAPLARQARMVGIDEDFVLQRRIHGRISALPHQTFVERGNFIAALFAAAGRQSERQKRQRR